MTPPSKRRCAIYTRKSSEEGLEQSFNSLHAQREACEAYIKSQAHEGWRLIRTAYDDGGISGGTMDRPGLRRLLADVEAGLIDVVVVYKVDRLTRSLGDFGRIVEAFDHKGVSFVSVTQAFNTTTSMGRLTLNVLLSFAQFEREVTGERIRDKIAQSKAKGMWMAGVAPFGYDAPGPQSDRALIVTPDDAEQVRGIFRRYVELGSVHALARELDEQGVRSKAWVTVKGRAMGGRTFSRGALFHLLKNRTYLGEITHKGASYPGRHAAIVDSVLFEAVQQRLYDNRVAVTDHRTSAARLPLTGLIVDAHGDPMSPTSARGKSGGLYRYYVSAPLQQGRSRQAAPGFITRVPALALDQLVLDHLQPVLNGPPGLKSNTWQDAKPAIRQVQVLADSIVIRLDRSAIHPSADPSMLTSEPTRDDQVRLIIKVRFQLRGGRSWITPVEGRPQVRRAEPDAVLIRGLKAAHRIARAAGADPDRAAPSAVLRALDSSYDRNLFALAFLAPDIQAAILEGRQPSDLKLERLIKSELPLAWADQRALLMTGAS